jgi:hypothetical protein
MKRILLSIVLSLAAVAASAQTFPTAIESIAPALGTVSGGDVVTIVLNAALPSCPVCSPPAYLAEVTFDGVPARKVVAWTNTISAVTPAHAHGTVDVAVSSGGEPIGTAKFTYTGWDGPIDMRNYERILVPLALQNPVPGAFGSQWAGEFWASNHSQYPVELFSDVSCTLVCPQFLVPEPPYPQLAPQSVTRVEVPGGGAAGVHAFLFYLQKGATADVDFSLHVGDVSRAADNAGTEIGVVRESAFRGTTFDILNVPIDTLSRATLRLYDPDGNDNVSADLAFYSMASNTLIASTNVPLHPPVRRPATEIARTAPAFASFGQIADIRNAFAFTQGSSFPTGRVRVRVTLRDGASRGWAFVAVTNNTTQLITTYKPE